MVVLKILKSFSYGSISDPTKMVAGNIVSMDVKPDRLKKWVEMRWVKVME